MCSALVLAYGLKNEVYSYVQRACFGPSIKERGSMCSALVLAHRA